MAAVVRQRSRWGVLLSALALFITGCHRPVAPLSSIGLTNTITPWPAHVGVAKVSLTLRDSASQPVVGAHILLEEDMSHPGMAPVFREAKEITPGSYEAQLELGMAGDWLLLLHITLADGQKLDREIELKGVETR